MDKKHEIYKSCNANIRRTCVEDQAVEPEVFKYLSENSRVLPCFEMTYYERKYLKAHSMLTNELLRCRWQQYNNLKNRKITTFHFPRANDLHFYNGAVQLMPELTTSNFPDVKMKKLGPGIDSFGELPIPQESFMKRGIAKKRVNFSKMVNHKKILVDKEEKQVKTQPETGSKKNDGKKLLREKS